MSFTTCSRRHLVAVQNFRGLMRGREHQLILQRFTELKKKLGNASGAKTQVLFGDMQVTVNTDCLSNLLYSCLSFLLPDSYFYTDNKLMEEGEEAQVVDLFKNRWTIAVLLRWFNCFWYKLEFGLSNTAILKDISLCGSLSCMFEFFKTIWGIHSFWTSLKCKQNAHKLFAVVEICSKYLFYVKWRLQVWWRTAQFCLILK